MSAFSVPLLPYPISLCVTTLLRLIVWGPVNKSTSLNVLWLRQMFLATQCALNVGSHSCHVAPSSSASAGVAGAGKRTPKDRSLSPPSSTLPQDAQSCSDKLRMQTHRGWGSRLGWAQDGGSTDKLCLWLWP